MAAYTLLSSMKRRQSRLWSHTSGLLHPGNTVLLTGHCQTSFRSFLSLANTIEKCDGVDYESCVFLSPSKIISDTKEHTMEDSLFRYIGMKMHETITHDPNCNHIWVRGKYDREDNSNNQVSSKEKSDKMFNWQRPTAQVIGSDVLINVFPGMDYTIHYANLIQTYLTIHKRDTQTKVYYSIPSDIETMIQLHKSNLKHAPKSKTAIIGYGLERIGDFLGGSKCQWEGEGPFRFLKIRTRSGDATLIGCEFSIWGDIGGKVVHYLGTKLNFEKVIYIGKVGGLKPDHKPNQLLCTGNCSYVNGEYIYWDNIFEKFINHQDGIINGKHYCSVSTIFETKRWLKEHANTFDFVDPEIGQMARYARASGTQFSYLHLISNNLTQLFSEDLSTERDPVVRKKRENLLANKITSIISEL